MATPAAVVRCTPALLATISLFVCSGCASLTSTRVRQDNKSPDGLIYFLPTRDISVSVTKAKDSPLTISVQTTDPIPDLDHAYVARVPRNQLGTSNGSIQVKGGLLNSDSSSKLTSNLTSILQQVVGLGGLREGITFSQVDTVQEKECGLGTYSGVINVKQGNSVSLCGVKFGLQRVAATSSLPKPTQAGETSASGLFYRIPLPYIVKAEQAPAPGQQARTQEFVVFSPSESPTYFLPAARTGFGTNDATFSFEYGVPTKYGQTIQSEMYGFVGLPASLVEAYFKAIGNVFNQRQGVAASERAYIEALNALTLSTERRGGCIAALSTDDLVKIRAACGP